MKDNNFEGLVKELNARQIKQQDVCWEENIPDDIWQQFFASHTVVDSDIDIDKHRWYEVSTTVVNLDDRFLGISHISNIYSEATDPEDIGRVMEFFEMEETVVVSYERK